jgi:D-serine deaminase-like pyridoxal phosphate-dependent protein
MVDCIEHIQQIEKELQKRSSLKRIKICVDADMSWRPMGIHLGVHRSPIRSLDDFKALYKYIKSSSWVDLAGVMGYEAQVAGMGEQNPFSSVLNPIKKFIKKKSIRDVSRKRGKISEYLRSQGVYLEIFNGGGSGSLNSTSKEPWITEVAAGSGFLQSHLFDYFADNSNIPAFSFALPITRLPQKGIVTCKSGGFIASGETSKDKSPVPFLPKNLKITDNEGFGEVQTPVLIPDNSNLKLGDPIFFRPSKAGEIAERFNEYILIREGKIIDRVPTYRGLGKCFF